MILGIPEASWFLKIKTVFRIWQHKAARCRGVTPLREYKTSISFFESIQSRQCTVKTTACQTYSFIQSTLAENKLSAINKDELLENCDTPMIIIILIPLSPQYKNNVWNIPRLQYRWVEWGITEIDSERASLIE